MRMVAATNASKAGTCCECASLHPCLSWHALRLVVGLRVVTQQLYQTSWSAAASRQHAKCWHMLEPTSRSMLGCAVPRTADVCGSQFPLLFCNTPVRPPVILQHVSCIGSRGWPQAGSICRSKPPQCAACRRSVHHPSNLSQSHNSQQLEDMLELLYPPAQEAFAQYRAASHNITVSTRRVTWQHGEGAQLNSLLANTPDSQPTDQRTPIQAKITAIPESNKPTLALRNQVSLTTKPGPAMDQSL